MLCFKQMQIEVCNIVASGQTTLPNDLLRLKRPATDTARRSTLSFHFSRVAFQPLNKISGATNLTLRRQDVFHTLGCPALVFVCLVDFIVKRETKDVVVPSRHFLQTRPECAEFCVPAMLCVLPCESRVHCGWNTEC